MGFIYKIIVAGAGSKGDRPATIMGLVGLIDVTWLDASVSFKSLWCLDLQNLQDEE
jgi:hypothetical protein